MSAAEELIARASGLEHGANGIWFARRQAALSYPASGNAACFAVEDTSFWFAHRNRCILSAVRRFPSDGVFLDIGGGNGFVARALSGAGIACIVLEPGHHGAFAARARGIDPVICATLEETGLPEGSIAAAGMFDVLEHIEDDAAALRRVHALLRPGGLLFVTVPAHPLLFSDEDRHAGHFRRYKSRNLARLLGATGFRVEFLSHIFAPLPPLIFLRRTLPSRLRPGRSVPAGEAAADHLPSGIAARLLERLLAAELAMLAAGRSFPFGGSCLCAARRA